MEGFVAWFNARTGREQLLLKVAAVLILGGGGLLMAYQTIASYRETSGADLASAMQIRDDLAKLKTLAAIAPSAPVPANDGSVRGIVAAAASQNGLTPARIEPDGPTGIRTAFQPANAQNVYQWLDTVERAGLVVSRIALVRVGEGDIVEAGATIASR